MAWMQKLLPDGLAGSGAAETGTEREKFLGALSQGSWGAAARELSEAYDGELPADRASTLLTNRAVCQLRQQLYRKALQVCLAQI